MANNPKNFRFPRSFTLFGHKYRVEFVSDLYKTEYAFGLYDDEIKVLRIQAPGKLSKTYPGSNEEILFEFTDTSALETFFHEMVHAILYAMDRDSLSDNEPLVGMFGKALLEIYLTSEYDEKETTKKS